MRIHKKPHFFSKFFRGFTLVELIVVISVLAVLATIAMSQASNITAWARDSQRMTDISSMKSAIELYKAKTGKLPIPTNGSEVTYSWGLLWIQGTFGESVTREIKSITPKPIDPINRLEYVYSIANNNREFELGGILEKATGLLLPIPQPLPQGRGVVGKEMVGAFPRKALPTPLSKALLEGWIFFDETLAASQNVTFIEWTYNGISLKVETGSKTYVVAAPSLIGGYLGDSKMENTGLTIEGLGSLPAGFSGTAASTANTGTFTPVVGWSGSKLPETATWAEALVAGLQSAYTGTVATSLSQISSLVNATGSQITALGQGLIQNALGGTISISADQNPETPLTPFFIGSGTTTTPWKKHDGTALASCQEYNLNATHINTGALRGAGSCGGGTKQCLTDGVYLINPSGSSEFQTWCDMNADGGGWTVVLWPSNPINNCSAIMMSSTSKYCDATRAYVNNGSNYEPLCVGVSWWNNAFVAFCFFSSKYGAMNVSAVRQKAYHVSGACAQEWGTYFYNISDVATTDDANIAANPYTYNNQFQIQDVSSFKWALTGVGCPWHAEWSYLGIR